MRTILVATLLYFLTSCYNQQEKPMTSIKAQIVDFKINGNKGVEKGVILNAGDKLLYDVYTTVERIDFSVSLKPNDKTSIRIGREGGGYINLIEDSVHVYQLNEELNSSERYESIPVKWNTGEDINISVSKVNEACLKYEITTPDSTFEMVYDKNKLDQPNRRAALAWGKPFLKVETGEIEIKDANISSNYNLNSKLTIVGDSFIEGATLVDWGLENRWCALLAQSIGKNDIPIIGKGGERIDAAFIDRFEVENSWYRTPYVIISLGTNNSDIDSYKTYMQQLINKLKANRQTVILTTITPRPEFEFGTTAKLMNEWVRSSGELYIDMHKAVTKADEPSSWKDEYVLADGVHPSVLGHLAMFRQVKIDCPFLIYL